MNRPWLLLTLLAASLPHLPAQELNRAAVAGRGEDESAVLRGAGLFAARCAACHGPEAKGTAAGADLIRSVPVRDDEKGERIAPLLRTAHPAGDLPALTGAQTGDLVAWLHVQVYAAANRDTYRFLNILTGDPKQGERFFSGAGKCATCHSVTGDLAGIGARFDPAVLQSMWMNPLRGRRGARSSAALTVTVTPAGGASVSGPLLHLDEFNVALRDASGAYRSFALDGDATRVEVHDPLQAHFDLYRTLTDADMHNVTAYLATLQ